MNNNPQLSTQEVEKLFEFVNSKNVKYEDLKYEIVDHLASSIEDIKENDPKATFDSALNETYDRFPITGFAQFVEEKKIALNKYWERKFVKYCSEYFRLPKIILLLTMTLFIWSLFQYFNHEKIVFWMMILLIVVFVLNVISFIKTKILRKNYSFISSYYIVTFIMNYGLLYSFELISDFFDKDHTFSLLSVTIISIHFAINLMFNYATFYVFPKMLQKEVQKKYAHLNIKLA